MRRKLYKQILLFLITIIFLTGCGNKAIFDELAENRVKVIIKGTYESNNPRPWDTTIPQDDSVYVYPGSANDENPDTFMIDLAGLKIISGDQHQYFANFRVTYSAALNDSDSFFNGTGFLYRNNDMRPDFTWHDVDVYIRKMIFNKAKEYNLTGYNIWSFNKDIEETFHEEKVNGLNFNLFQTISYYDSLKKNSAEINRIFPLVVPIEDGFVFDYNEKETVLEIRLVVKNFVKKYEYEYKDADENNKLGHFYALSDWLRDVKRDEPGAGIIGGNLLASARYYVPGKTATITGNARANNCYIAAITTAHDISEYNITLPLRPANSGSDICDAPKKPRTPLLPSNPSSDDINNYIEGLLDYYLQYEVYKENNDLFAGCVDSGKYESDWNNYETTLQAYKIPQLITWADASGSFMLENVPVGKSYNLYRCDEIINSGSLPSGFATYIGTVTLTEADINASVSVK